MVDREPRVVLSEMDTAVVGRSRELADVRQVVHAIDELPAAISLIGEPGIGKTTVWEWGVEAARAAGYVALESRLAESEAGLSFTALGDLFAGVFPSVADSLVEAQRRALGAALLLSDAGPDPADARTIGVAVLSSLRLLSARQPVLIAIDDAQWLDRASADALGFALRRLTTEHVALLTARRSGPPAGRRVDAASALNVRMRTLALELGGLSLGALHVIVVERFARPLPRPRLRRLHELSRGNPFLAVELVRAAQSRGVELESPEYVGAELDHLLGARLGRLPASTRRLLLASAAASRPSLWLLERAADADPRRDLEPAVRAGIVEVVGSDVRFSHPLLASAAYGTASPDDRRLVHARLAELITDADERAHHLALATREPDEAVAAEVERAAEEVFRRGAPASAAELATMAVRLTPRDRVIEVRRRAARRAEYLFESGDTEAAAAVVEAQIASAAPGNERARLLALLARIRHFHDDLEAGNTLNERALAEARGDDALAASIQEGLAWGLLLTRRDLRRAARYARSAVKAAERAASDVALAESLAAHAVTALAIGAPAARSMQRAMDLEPALVGLRVLRHPTYAKAYILSCTDRLAEARALYVELAARAEMQGDESALPSIHVQLSMVELLAGAWAEAEEYAETGVALAEQGGQHPSLAALRSRLALLAAWRGRLEAAESQADAALRLAGAADDTAPQIARALTRGGEIAVWALGAVCLGRGRHAEAVRYLSPLADVLLGAGVREPGELRFLADYVEALLGAERRDAAEQVVTAFEDIAADARRDGPRGIAARCRAMVEIRDGRPETALAAAESAVRLLDGSQLPLEVGRARLILGEIQRRAQQRRAARESLIAAAATFDSLGAELWAARTRTELGRVGGRPSSPNLLTPTESRVAQLVAEGMANKEVAAALGIATKTVELHLSRVYSKLGLGSRTELVRHLSTHAETAP